MRVGQKNSLVYQWAKKGTRPLQPKDQRYENAYLFGAVCPSRDTGVAIIMPYANTAAMRKHLEEISRAVAPGAPPWSFSTKLVGTPRANSRCRKTLQWYHCRRLVRNSTRRRTSGNTCVRPLSPIGCSRATLTFSMPVRRPGKSSSTRPVESPPSQPAIGQSSVNQYEGWYNGLIFF